MNFNKDKTFSCTIKNAEINPDIFNLILEQAEALRKEQEYFEKHLFIVGSEEVKKKLEEEIPNIKVSYDPSNTVPPDEIWIMEEYIPNVTFNIEEPNIHDDIMLYGFPPRYGFDFLNYKKPKFYIDIEGNNNEQSRESQE